MFVTHSSNSSPGLGSKKMSLARPLLLVTAETLPAGTPFTVQSPSTVAAGTSLPRSSMTKTLAITRRLAGFAVLSSIKTWVM